MVIDFEGLELDAGLREIVAKVRPNDPYIAAVRVGQNQPRAARAEDLTRAGPCPEHL